MPISSPSGIWSSRSGKIGLSPSLLEVDDPQCEAVQAEVPLGIARLDYATHTVRLVDFLRLSGDEARDMARIAECLAGVRGLHPENAAPIQLLAAHVPRSETIVR